MYKTILVTLDGTPTDRAIIEHIKQLAKLAQSRVYCCMWPTVGPRELLDRTRSAPRSPKIPRI
jgi:hypothetical protein